MKTHDIHSGALPFPGSLPEFQKLFPDDYACVAYLERIHFEHGFRCHCGWSGEPYRITGKPWVLRCRKCQGNTSLMANTIMERTHTPLSTWFWAAYLITTMTPGMSAVQFQRQLGLSRYETAFQILHKLRAGMVRPDRDRIGGKAAEHVEIDETWVGGKTRGEGKGTHHQTLVSAAVEVRTRKPKDLPGDTHSKAVPRRGGRYAGRLRLAVVPNRTAKTLVSFVEASVEPGTMIVTDDWGGYDSLSKIGYQHLQVAERGEAKTAEEYLPIVHLIFSNMKAWLLGVHHGVAPQHLQAYLNEFTFRFNRRFYPFNAFRSLLGVASDVEGPTYESLYDHTWAHPLSLTG
jgi:transposase-like protein